MHKYTIYFLISFNCSLVYFLELYTYVYICTYVCVCIYIIKLSIHADGFTFQSNTNMINLKIIYILKEIAYFFFLTNFFLLEPPRKWEI